MLCVSLCLYAARFSFGVLGVMARARFDYNCVDEEEGTRAEPHTMEIGRAQNGSRTLCASVDFMVGGEGEVAGGGER